HMLGAAAPAPPADRAKAPHWVDPGTWSMWIAAANEGNVTAAAAATAMGITPGVSGAPQSFAPMPHDGASENELLRMFESITKDSPVNQTSTS
ncbi:hypothetical protein LPJ70_000845, partial [Coemansia sp. RSA 2708]